MKQPKYAIDAAVWLIFKDAPLRAIVNTITIQRNIINYSLTGIRDAMPEHSIYASLEDMLQALREIGQRQEKKAVLPPVSFPSRVEQEEWKDEPRTPIVVINNGSI
jgi:hypothetical protein